jgi:hypothetical protein
VWRFPVWLFLNREHPRPTTPYSLTAAVLPFHHPSAATYVCPHSDRSTEQRPRCRYVEGWTPNSAPVQNVRVTGAHWSPARWDKQHKQGVLGPLFRTAGHTARTQHGVTASAGQRRGDVEIRNYMRDQAGTAGAWSSTCPSHTTVKAPEATCSRTVCYRIPRTSMRLCVLLRSAKLTAIGNNQDISFSPPLCPHPPACTASFCVFFFYRPTGRPRRTSLPLKCHRNATNRTRSISSARHSTSR